MDGHIIDSSAGAKTAGGSMYSPSTSTWEIGGFQDANGDDKADVLWKSKLDGHLSIWLMDGSTIVNTTSVKTATDSVYNAPVSSWELGIR